VKLPSDLSALLRESILFPGETKETVNMKLVEQAPSPSTTGTFAPPDRAVKLQALKHLSLELLTSITEELTDFVYPLAQYIDILVYFKLHPSKVFNVYLQNEVEKLVVQEVHMEHALKDQKEEQHARLPVTVSILRNSLERTVALMVKIVTGDATYREIVAGGLLGITSSGSQKFPDVRFDVEKEFQDLVECPQIGSYCTDGLYRIKCLLKLLQLPHYVEMIDRVCGQYHLHKCQEGADFKKILKWAIDLRSEEERASLTPADAVTKWKEVQKIFCLHDDASLKCLDLFSKIADSVDFYHFLEEKQFTGKKGEVLFRQQYDLVTAQLQHEEYNETVLNHLYAAFEFISPFTDPGQAFSCLMKVVTTLDTTEGIIQLDTIKNNMHLIRLWFSRAEVSCEL